MVLSFNPPKPTKGLDALSNTPTQSARALAFLHNTNLGHQWSFHINPHKFANGIELSM
jgi:hypothetical protein